MHPTFAAGDKASWAADEGRAAPDAELLAPAARAFDLRLLSPAERRVLTQAMAGRSAREIADSLVLSEATVRSHLSRLYSKLGVRGRVELLARIAETAPDEASAPLDRQAIRAGPDRSVAWPLIAAAAVTAVVGIVLPPLGLVLAPALAVAGLICRRSEVPATRRAAPWVFLAALVVGLWLAIVLVGLALVLPVDVRGESVVR